MKKHTYAIIILTMSSWLLTGCGLGSELPSPEELFSQKENSGEEIALTQTIEISQEATRILTLSQKFLAGDISVDEVLELAGLYEANGLVLNSRDLCEQAYRLTGDRQILDHLQTLSVNGREESQEIQTELEGLMKAMSGVQADGGLDLGSFCAVLEQTSGSKWVQTMMPKLFVGRRTYYMEEKEELKLILGVGYDDQGRQSFDIWYNYSPETYIHVSRNGDSLKIYRETVTDEPEETVVTGVAMKHNSTDYVDFEVWTFSGVEASENGDVAKFGTVMCEQGHMKKGQYVGDYVAKVASVEVDPKAFADSIQDLQGQNYEVYVGHFDSNGHTTLPQPGEADLSALAGSQASVSCVVYAYDSTGTKCLFLGTESQGQNEGLSFGDSLLGLKEIPEVDLYTPNEELQSELTEYKYVNMLGEKATASKDEQPKEEASAEPESAQAQAQVRVFDGQVQVYSNGMWITMGDVESLVEADPFNEYERTGTVPGNDTAGNGTSGDNSSANEANGNGNSVENTGSGTLSVAVGVGSASTGTTGTGTTGTGTTGTTGTGTTGSGNTTGSGTTKPGTGTTGSTGSTGSSGTTKPGTGTTGSTGSTGSSGTTKPGTGTTGSSGTSGSGTSGSGTSGSGTSGSGSSGSGSSGSGAGNNAGSGNGSSNNGGGNNGGGNNNAGNNDAGNNGGGNNNAGNNDAGNNGGGNNDAGNNGGGDNGGGNNDAGNNGGGDNGGGNNDAGNNGGGDNGGGNNDAGNNGGGDNGGGSDDNETDVDWGDDLL